MIIHAMKEQNEMVKQRIKENYTDIAAGAGGARGAGGSSMLLWSSDGLVC